ncbi:hypothetical protein GQ600_7713 [Phytophthora cactorum]|nr:hypothetical protein GQ600_7713 [Phytophthora cactorum]
MKKSSLSLLLSNIPPTSNFVERCFSVARTTNGQERHSLQSIALEMVLFLRQNESRSRDLPHAVWQARLDGGADAAEHRKLDLHLVIGEANRRMQ